jgi:hypothetical protein
MCAATWMGTTQTEDDDVLLARLGAASRLIEAHWAAASDSHSPTPVTIRPAAAPR